ncbi:secretion protein [uncultured Prevotella sp.]|uniref:secretion protein n=1 Tax=uncultured Prevotella sp. TaxID=159272 RepID=UPI002590BEDD|nr:secretion protein [uncultured Prevotella sp.]
MYNNEFFAKIFGKFENIFYLCPQINITLMQKRLLIIATAISLAFAIPAQAITMIAEMGVAEQVEETTPTIKLDKNAVTVQGGNGMVLEVVSLTGKAVASYKIEGPAQRVELNLPKGCYILKVGKTVRKITLR